MLGQRIAVLRRSAGMSQAELARRLQVSPSAVGMYEQERREPSAETVVALSRIFGVSTDYLLTGHAVTVPDAETLSRIFDRCLSRASQRPERRGRGFSDRELAAVLEALLLEP